MKITCMRGYSGSGKSTRARQIATETGAVVVCRDDLRMMLLGSYWTGKNTDEDRVTVAEEAQVTALLRAGIPVVVDATHIHAPYLRKWARLATRLGVSFEVVDVHSDLDECKRRDHARMLAGGRYVGDSLIDKQAKRAPAHKWPAIKAEPFVVEPVEYIPGLPTAIIVDIDGTVAHATGRSPYDYSQVHTDEVDPDVAGLVEDIYDYRHYECCYPMGDYTRVLFVSGRDDECKEATEGWLALKRIRYDELHMRPTKAVDSRGNKLPDYLIKYDIFNTYIRGKYNVRFVLDDRNQVVDMWRKLGLKCLQVQEGDF